MTFSIDQKRLTELLQENLDHLADMRRRKLEPVESAADVANGDMIPLPFFGDIESFAKSRRRIVTVGLNPSNCEFQKGKRDKTWARRFDHAVDTPPVLLGELKSYFRRNPYSWFNTFESVLSGCGCTYGMNETTQNVAIHIDVCSPIATSPTWSKLGIQNAKDAVQKTEDSLRTESCTKRELTAVGNELFKKMLDMFKPDIVIASVGRSHLKQVLPVVPMELLFPIRDTDAAQHTAQHGPPNVLGGKIAFGENTFYFANGSMRNVPFGSFSRVLLPDAGAAILAAASRAGLS